MRRIIPILLLTAFALICTTHGFFADNFILIPEQRTYEGAIPRCLRKTSGGKPYMLATNISEAESIDIYRFMIKEKEFKRAWIGVHRRFDAADVNTKLFMQEKMDGTLEPLGPNTFWGPKEPNNYLGHRERCVEVRILDKNSETANWNDAPCDRLNYMICRSPDSYSHTSD